MNDTVMKLRVATVALLALVFIALMMNTCALDRIEGQVVRNTKAVEKLRATAGSGLAGRGGSGPARGGSARAVEAEPGESSGVKQVGWGGSVAEVLHVEGAAADAPLTIADKPLPQGDYYVRRRNSPPSTLNYFASNEGETNQVNRMIQARLMGIDYDAPPKTIPELAMRWEVSDDKLTYIYHMRRGAQFGDGRPVTSADVKFSFDVVRDPTVEATHLRPSLEDVESLTTPDAYTVVVKYKKKYWKGLYTVGYGLYILNRGWYEEQIPLWAEKLDIETYATEPGRPGFGEVFNKITIPPPGAGPFYYDQTEYDLDAKVKLEQNPFWFGIQAHPTWYNTRGVRWVWIDDEIAAFEEFRKQKFDITTVDFNQWDDELSKDPTVTDIARYFEYDHTGLAFSFITWNCRKPPFDDPRVRRAMTHLVNRQWILDELERGRGKIGVCPSKPIYDSYSHDLEPWPFDVEKAKALLAEAGWTDTDGDGVLDKNGEPFEFEFKYGSSRPFYVQVIASLGDACKKAGIRMSPRKLEWATFIEDFYARRFDAVCLYNSFPDPWLDPYEDYHSSQDVPRGGNHPGWHSDEADRLLEAMRVEFDDDKRNEMFHRFNEIFHEEQPQTLLVHGIVGVLQNARFEDAKVRPTGLQPFSLWVKPENVLHE